ncbi:MAG TPA: hypothetical protein VNH18_16690 [Bryobacteraceae bacterium]|nr:hypothetical protein [Bryobacteraceae bacterium]HXJ40920.1 hypothetical protein [Bryobacteraceae bacterium]
MNTLMRKQRMQTERTFALASLETVRGGAEPQAGAESPLAFAEVLVR